MDYGRPPLADALAAEYVLGTLRGAARRRFEALLPAHAALRDATEAWQARLLPLSAAIDPVPPPERVWQQVSARIGAAAPALPASAPVAPGAWHRLSFWRGLSAFASVAAIGLAVLLTIPRAVPPPIVVVLAATPAATGAPTPAAPSIVASISGDGSTLVTRPIVPVAVGADRSLELWAVPKAGPARSLGVLPGGSGTVALRGGVLADVDTLAVTVEPPGGSPTGAPTGPIVYAGKFSL
ncbi:MAG TPA: anti-sigma factor [Caldimonas sp.]|jgi:anti-sigma-K factor RskA|nr:anti-sigma factor [Caldimonas sp.]HEX2540651.1 anti-sigma factor [Caldimonas sp.]